MRVERCNISAAGNRIEFVCGIGSGRFLHNGQPGNGYLVGHFINYSPIGQLLLVCPALETAD